MRVSGSVLVTVGTTGFDELIAAGEVTYNSDWFSSSNYNNYLYPNAIDPTIYYDTDGKMYMCYGSWSGGIFLLEIDEKTTLKSWTMMETIEGVTGLVCAVVISLFA